VRHRVAFYETDAMGVVHHSNYVRFLEHARVVWLDEHDQPYTSYMELGLNFATTRVEVDYERAARFDEEIEIVTWLEWIRFASMRFAYVVRRGEEVLVTAATEHAAVDLDGRARRVPKERRDSLKKCAAGDP
jgi:acyl-CoA thioester hydrolase